MMYDSIHSSRVRLPLVVLAALVLFLSTEPGAVATGLPHAPVVSKRSLPLPVLYEYNAQRQRDPCQLLSDAEVRAVQGHVPAQKIPSEQPAGSFQFTQCFYRTPEFTNSVSVALAVPLATDSKRSGPRQYWQAQFNRKPKAVPSRKKKEPPKPVAGLGDEAFWVGDPMTGALYILKGEVFLRVSVGGPPDQTQKIQRAKSLASYALKRLDTNGPSARSR